MGLVLWLATRQRELGEADRPFGRRLGVSGAYWGDVRRGEQRLTLLMVKAAIRAFPEYEKHIIKLALADDTGEHRSRKVVA